MVELNILDTHISKIMKAKFVSESLLEFQRGLTPLASVGIGMEGLLKREMEDEGKWTEDRREQLLWSVANNKVKFVIYLFESGVDPGKIYWTLIKSMKEHLSEDMKEILYFYEYSSLGNLTDERIKYFKRKYKDYKLGHKE